MRIVVLLIIAAATRAGGESVVVEPEAFAGLELFCVNQWADIGWHDFRNVTLQVVRPEYKARTREDAESAVQISLPSSRILDEVERDSSDNFDLAIGSKIDFPPVAPFSRADCRDRRLWTPQSLLGNRRRKYLWVVCSAPSDHLAARVRDFTEWLNLNDDRTAVIQFIKADPSPYEALFNSRYYSLTTWILVVLYCCNILLGVSFLVGYHQVFRKKNKHGRIFRTPIAVLALDLGANAFILASIAATWNRTRASAFFKPPIMWALTSHFSGFGVFTTALVWKHWENGLKALKITTTHTLSSFYFLAAMVAVLDLALFLPVAQTFGGFFNRVVGPLLVLLSLLLTGIAFLRQARKMLNALNFVATANGTLPVSALNRAGKGPALKNYAVLQLKSISRWIVVLAVSNIFFFILLAAFAIVPVTALPTLYNAHFLLSSLTRLVNSTSKFYICRLPLRYRAKTVNGASMSIMRLSNRLRASSKVQSARSLFNTSERTPLNEKKVCSARSLTNTFEREENQR